jgi:hypothetical protein
MVGVEFMVSLPRNDCFVVRTSCREISAASAETATSISSEPESRTIRFQHEAENCALTSEGPVKRQSIVCEALNRRR